MAGTCSAPFISQHIIVKSCAIAQAAMGVSERHDVRMVLTLYLRTD